MRYALTAALLLATAAPAAAQSSLEAAKDSMCSSLAEAAVLTMTARQKTSIGLDVVLGSLTASFSEFSGAPEALAPFLRAMVIEAYDTPQWGDASVQEQEIRAFRDRKAVACYTELLPAISLEVLGR